MSEQAKILFGNPAFLPVVFFGVLIIYLLRQLALAPGFSDELILAGADDAMRLQSVRDLLAGQEWFDTRQYRVLPPGGISLHWSRLVDAPLAILLSALAWGLDMDAAERLLVLMWPMMLFLVFAWITMRVTRTGFGVSAAVLALVSLWFLQSYHTRYFPIGRLDHHNVQLLLMLAVFGLLFSSTWKAAALAGWLAAVSIAVGMESLPFLGLAGFVWVWRFLRCLPESEKSLAAFSLSLGLSAFLLFVLQTDPALWGQRVCDQLSLPYLELLAWIAGVGFLVLISRKRLLTLRARAIFLSVTAAGFGVLVLPRLAPCFGGPFSDVASEVRLQVISRIGESTPAGLVILQAPAMAFVLLAPLGLITLLAIIIWLQQIMARRDTDRWGLLVLFLALGCVGAFLQLRAMIWGHAVMAVGFGAVMAHLLNQPWSLPRGIKSILLAGLFAVIFLPQLVPVSFSTALAALKGSPTEPFQVGLMEIDADCDRPSLLRNLPKHPPALIALPLNLSTSVLVHTPHSVTAAPYHRSTDAMLNGVLPFTGDIQALKRLIESTGADLVLVCAGQIYGTAETAGSNLAAGQRPDWLMPIDGIPSPLMLFRVKN